jgi:hypothetical protein
LRFYIDAESDKACNLHAAQGSWQEGVDPLTSSVRSKMPWRKTT